MAQITIVGLGPGTAEHLTLEAWRVLAAADVIWLRTARHPVVAELPAGPTIHAFDALYETAETFADVYAAIVAQVLALGRREAGVVYAVPGHPLIGETTAPMILATARAEGLPCRVVAGLSFIEPTLAAVESTRAAERPWRDPIEGLQLVDALDLAALHHPPLNPDSPALIAQVYSRAVASELKLTLMNQYPDEYQVALVDAAGTAMQRVAWLPLYEIDRQEVGPLTSLFIPALPFLGGFEAFQETVAQLRAPDGCPWDREQTHVSLRASLLEETYEVLAAIDGEEMDALREELGDLLLQVVLHTQIATEEGDFQMPEVIAAIDAKLKHRHPHVWGQATVAGADEVLFNWEAIKRAERESNGQAERSALAGVSKSLPALAQAHAYGVRAQRVGFDWPSMPAVIRQVREELAALEGATDPAQRALKVGDALAALVHWARWLEVDPESALREANLRFAQRFYALEQLARQRGVSLTAVTAAEVAQLWREAGMLV